TPAAAAPERPGRNGPGIDALRSELDAVRLQLEFLDVKVRDTRGHVRRLEGKIEKQQARIAELQTTLDAIASESVQLTTRIASLSEALEAGQARMAEIRKRFRGRLVHLHRVRQSTLVSSIFTARDLTSFISRSEMVRHLMQSDRDLLRELNERKHQLEADTAEIQLKQQRLAELTAQTLKSREAIEAEGNALSAMLQTLLLERKVFLARQEKLKKSRDALEREMQAVESQRARDPEAVEQELDTAPPPQTERRGGQGAPPSFVAPRAAPAPDASGARFRWPIANVEGLSFENTGGSAPPALELVITGETEILAAARGKVLFKGPVGQFGNIVILGHKNGFSTVYGRLDDVWVGLGEVIEAGDTIGRILGNRQNRLHFEIRLAGKNADPLAHLPKLR
ncbi:MAG TPA: peptidoglycan DD-metalloendopeptidase family protein, partial [Candidatus Ozemobacteraceae bacterium]